MRSPNESVIAALALVRLSGVFGADGLCEKQALAYSSCLRYNQVTCALTCPMDDGFGAPTFTTCIEGVSKYCKLLDCCPECTKEIKHLRDCSYEYLGVTCDTKCHEVSLNVEESPAAVAVVGYNKTASRKPSQNPGQCDEETADLGRCYRMNPIACLDCQALVRQEAVTCDGFRKICKKFGNCCGECMYEAKRLVTCQGRYNGCSNSCGSAASILERSMLVGLVSGLLVYELF